MKAPDRIWLRVTMDEVLHILWYEKRERHNDVEYIKISKMWAATDALNNIIDKMQFQQTADEQLIREMRNAADKILSIAWCSPGQTNAECAELNKYEELIKKADKRLGECR